MEYTKSKDSSDRLMIENYDVSSIKYWWIKRQLIKKFHLEKKTDAFQGATEKFQIYSSEDAEISIDWDNWSGFTVTALNAKSDRLVLDIANFLNKKNNATNRLSL